MGLEPDVDMGDLFYLLREDEEALFGKIKEWYLSAWQLSDNSSLRRIQSIIWNGERAEVRHFLEILLEKTDFEVLVLDMGCVMNGFF